MGQCRMDGRGLGLTGDKERRGTTEGAAGPHPEATGLTSRRRSAMRRGCGREQRTAVEGRTDATRRACMVKGRGE
uniref:Uncharacterized protein n=1 Tax=Setaria viridis TaxID=4556 RepID=A0A4U6V527_SETVI|nr:hypothetical protein SEVIR_4G281702v2 [Setaria viridis]